jgi:tmRNA-binding protein
MAPSLNEQYIVDEKGNPTAVILPIKEYKKMLSVLEEVEDHRERKILSQSAEFKKLVKRGTAGYQSRENQTMEGSLG